MKNEEIEMTISDKVVVQDMASSIRRVVTTWRLWMDTETYIISKDAELGRKISAFLAAGEDLVTYVRARLEIK